LDHGFSVLSPWSVSSVAMESVMRQHIMAGSMWWSQAAHLTADSKQRKRERDQVPISPSGALPQWPKFLQ
jgi:hypothetical protein